MTGQQLKNSILQEAIEGRLVPQDPNDEPASVLLERIRAEKARLVKEKKIILSKPEKNCICTPTCEYDLPENWVWCNLNDICRVFGRIGFRGYTKNDLRNRMIEGAISISPSNMKENSMDYTNCTYISMEKYEESPEIKINNGDILIVKTGSSYGKTTLVENLPWIATINPQIAVLKNISINKKYLLYFLQSPYAKDKYKEFVLGTSIPTFSQLNLISTSIPLPPLAEQNRIVEKIESLLPKVEAYGKAQEELEKLNEALPEQLKRSILQEAIEGRLVPQDPNDEPASVLLERIRVEKARLVKEKKIKKDKNESRIYRTEDGHWMEHFEDKNREDVCIDEEIPFDLPNGWEWCRLGNIQYLLTDGTHSRPQYVENGVPFLSVKDISSGKISFDNVKYISLEEHEKLTKRCNPQQGDLLISKVGTTGIPVIVDTKRNFSLFVSVALVKFFKEYINSSFLLLQINSPLVQEQVKRDTRGVGNKNWVLSAIYNTLLILPPLAEQHRIVEKIEALLPKIEKLKVKK